MKKIENKKVLIAGSEVTYGEQIKGVLTASIGKEGVTYPGIKQRNRIEDAMSKEEGGFFSFEDADFAALQSFLDTTSWTSYDREIENFITYIKDGGHKD